MSWRSSTRKDSDLESGGRCNGSNVEAEMALKAILDSVDDLPDDVKKEYSEHEGKFVLQVDGMKSQSDFDKLSTTLRKVTKEHGDLKKRIEPLGDRKIEDVITSLDRIPELEEAAKGKLDEAGIEKVVEGRIKAKLGPVERERDTLKGQLADKDKQIEDYTAKERRAAIHDAVRKAATTAKVLPEAIEDALLLAERVFELNEDGKVIAKDNVGVTPGIVPTDWFTDLQKTRPHWWGPSAGGGAGGNRGGGAGGDNPWTDAHWNRTKQGDIYKADKARAEQMAKAAGHASAVGANRPVTKK